MKAETNNIVFSPVTRWETNSILNLYKDAGWWKDEYDPDEIPRIIVSSYLFIVGFLEKSDKTIAMGRILSDGFNGIIQDMCVLSDYRRKGIGIKLLDFLVSSAINRGLRQITLVAEPGTIHFYKKSGFIAHEKQIFYLYSTGMIHEII